jgi:hypothetical protein
MNVIVIVTITYSSCPLAGRPTFFPHRQGHCDFAVPRDATHVPWHWNGKAVGKKDPIDGSRKIMRT